MNEIYPITSRPTGIPAQTERAQSERTPQREAARNESPASDRVEISAAAANYDPQAQAASAMDQRISEIRAQIANGTYLTPDKLDAAIERLYREVFGG
jgi:anti-sigma28 factor (negative regulator of flagellin synthesis)